jgi:hypothetical protein
MKLNVNPNKLLAALKPNTILTPAGQRNESVPSASVQIANIGPVNRITGVLVENISVRLDESSGSPAVLKLPDGRYRVRCRGQHCGVVNRNRRRYPIEVWQQHTKPDSAFMRRVKARRVIGQLEHPDDGRSSMGLGAIVITHVSEPDPATGEVMVEFETMSTPAGKIAAAYIADGVGFGISSRGNGSVVVDADGISVVQDDFDPVTFDLVLDESTPGAEIAAEKIREMWKEARIAWEEPADSKAVLLAESRAREALGFKGRLREEQTPSTHSEALLTAPDGSGTYKAFDNSVGQWDVYWMHASLPAEKIATAMPTLIAAKKMAEEHLAKILPGRSPSRGTGTAPSGSMDQLPPAGGAPTGGAAPVQVVNVNVKGESRSWAAKLIEAIKRESAEGNMPNNVAEDFVVLDGSPYSGVVLELEFGSPAEAKKACEAIEGAGFYCDLPDGEDELCVYTGFEDVDAAVSHVSRVLSMSDISPKADESRALKVGEGKVLTTSAFPRLIEFYGEEFPVNADDEFELWDEEGQPTKWGATKEARKGKGDSDDKEKDEARKGKGDDADKKADEARGKGDSDDKDKDESVVEGDDKKDDDKDESFVSALRASFDAVFEKYGKKGKGGKTSSGSMPNEARKGKGEDDDKKKDEAKGKGDDKDADKKDESTRIHKVLERKTAGQSNGRVEVFMEGENVVEVHEYDQSGTLVGFTGPRTAYTRLVAERRKGKGSDDAADKKKDEAKGKGDDADKDKKDEARGKGDAPAQGEMPKKPEAQPGAAGKGKGKGVATEGKTLASILPKILEGRTAAKPVAQASAPTSNKPAPAPAAPKPQVQVCEAHDTKIRHLQNEVARLEGENRELHSLVEAVSDVNAELEVRCAVHEAVRKNPELSRAEKKLLTCESKEKVAEESSTLLGLLLTEAAPSAPVKPAPVAVTTPTTATPKAPTPAPSATTASSGGASTTSVQSNKTQGAPTGPLVAESASTPGNLTGSLKESLNSGDEVSRVAAYRARKRQG